MQNFKHLALNGDSTQAERYLSESCEYVICTLNCDAPTIAHYCNYETANLVVNLTKNSFSSIQKLALDSGAVAKWPSLCSDIKTFALPTPKNPPQNENVIAQSPTANPRQNLSYKEKYSLALVGSFTLIFFGLLFRWKDLVKSFIQFFVCTYDFLTLIIKFQVQIFVIDIQKSPVRFAKKHKFRLNLGNKETLPDLLFNSKCFIAKPTKIKGHKYCLT